MTKNVKFICNAFSLQMLDINIQTNISISPIEKEVFEKVKTSIPSAVGHNDTARVLGVECNRVNVHLSTGDSIIVAQLQGGRLPEGATTLPEGFTFKYILVTVSGV